MPAKAGSRSPRRSSAWRCNLSRRKCRAESQRRASAAAPRGVARCGSGAFAGHGNEGILFPRQSSRSCQGDAVPAPRRTRPHQRGVGRKHLQSRRARPYLLELCARRDFPVDEVTRDIGQICSARTTPISAAVPTPASVRTFTSWRRNASLPSASWRMASRRRCPGLKLRRPSPTVCSYAAEP